MSSTPHRHLYLILLLLLITIQIKFPEGRTSPELLQPAKERGADREVMARALIGSRPPSCQERCNSCGHCEAVQVPVAPRKNGVLGPSHIGIAFRHDDGNTNYKPISWKCKCGNLILNP